MGLPTSTCAHATARSTTRPVRSSVVRRRSRLPLLTSMTSRARRCCVLGLRPTSARTRRPGGSRRSALCELRGEVAYSSTRCCGLCAAGLRVSRNRCVESRRLLQSLRLSRFYGYLGGALMPAYSEEQERLENIFVRI